MAAEKDRAENTHGLSALKDNIHTILFGRIKEKERLRGQFFYIADTPEFMKELGLTGDFFSIRYGVISRHLRKDIDHDLSEQNWLDLCKAITDPFVITLNKNTFRLFTNVLVNCKTIVVCVNVKNINKNIDINSISTAFGYRKRPVSGKIIFKSKKITPEQTALLDWSDTTSLPSVQRSNAEHYTQPIVNI